MPTPLSKRFPFKINLEKFLEKVEPKSQDITRTPTEVNFTYEKHYGVKLIASTDGIGLTVLSTRKDGRRVYKEMVSLIDSFRVDSQH